MLSLLGKKEWEAQHREPRQDYEDYEDVIVDALEGFEIVAANLSNKEMMAKASKGAIMGAAEQRASDASDAVIFSYSGGAPLDELASFLPTVLEYWESYAPLHIDFHESEESGGHKVPHLDLYDSDYWKALQLVCFAILLGHTGLLGRIMDLLAYENDDQDALLEALVAPYLPGRPEATIYTRQLPYRKTRKIFAAKPVDRPVLMAQYLDEWYDASRREPYHDRHKSSIFPGYWSLEAAAITFILDIDDSSYRDKPFYPADLVDYARQHSQRGSGDKTGDSRETEKQRSNVPAGQPCPEAGWWFTPAKQDSRRYFKQGETMPDVGGHYGATYWQWSPDQSAPTL
ncbi:PoNe immunity protein domain-containing protein [Nitrogeniibacter aestuarii]|uniref:PoNe immunity protein domain-containing protein n=1 Tax=Nitrogeniibacter aestuarii TaxID=2815343 RepID=UPI001D118AF7|nr:PoNe immunity protein domain-containing protein [Nitrogeniibacter aestuarii]